jgi:anthranilate phosphoribosyltransferase
VNSKKNKAFGKIISQIISGNSLNEKDAYEAFSYILRDEVTEMQQGAFLAALTAKKETEAEIAGGWRAIFELDTNKVTTIHRSEIVENCGTGMDSFKTFNISTAAAIVAASGGVKMARHGARAITSSCGTIDMAEALGVDIDCPVGLVASSIEASGIGLFNGMSSATHPAALGRILSRIHFGSPLNIAASLANPAHPIKAVRGVYRREMMEPVINVMQQIGYKNALVVHGIITKFDACIDEASVCGPTYCLHLIDGKIEEFCLSPTEVGLRFHDPKSIAAPRDILTSVNNIISLLSGQGCEAAADIVALNTALIFVVAEIVPTLREGVEMAKDIISKGTALQTLEKWVISQNRDPEKGRRTLYSILKN